LQKFEQWAEKYIELRGECVEIPSLVAVASFFLVGLRTYQHPLVLIIQNTNKNFMMPI
jgi:hypothetical protein